MLKYINSFTIVVHKYIFPVLFPPISNIMKMKKRLLNSQTNRRMLLRFLSSNYLGHLSSILIFSLYLCKVADRGQMNGLFHFIHSNCQCVSGFAYVTGRNLSRFVTHICDLLKTELWCQSHTPYSSPCFYKVYFPLHSFHLETFDHKHWLNKMVLKNWVENAWHCGLKSPQNDH